MQSGELNELKVSDVDIKIVDRNIDARNDLKLLAQRSPSSYSLSLPYAITKRNLPVCSTTDSPASKSSLQGKHCLAIRASTIELPFKTSFLQINTRYIDISLYQRKDEPIG